MADTTRCLGLGEVADEDDDGPLLPNSKIGGPLCPGCLTWEKPNK